MPRFACPICKAVITATEEERGTVQACSSCGKKIRVPQGKSAGSAGIKAPARSAAPQAETDPSPEPGPEEAGVTTGPPRRKPVPSDDDEGDIPIRSKPPRQQAREPEQDEDDEAETRIRSKPPRRPARAPEPDEEDEARDDWEDEEEEEDGKPGRRKKKQKQAGGFVVVSGIFGTIGAGMALGLFFIIVSGKGPQWLMDFIQEKLQDNGIPPLLAIGVTAAVFLIPLGLWFLATIKGAILSAIPEELEFRPTRPSKYPDLDVDRLEQLTEDFAALGFEEAIDYTLQTELENFAKGFARLMVHGEEGCYAEINQAFTPNGDAVPMRCVIVSHLEEDWSLMTTDRVPSKEGYLMRRPRAPWRSLPNKGPDQLLAHHRKMRKKMMKALQVELEGEPGKEAYFAREKEANRERKEVVRARWAPAILAEFFFFDRNPKFEWLGEYEAAD